MIGSFDRLFIENDKPKEVPRAIVDALSASLPEGFYYKPEGDSCILVPENPEDMSRVKIVTNMVLPSTTREDLEDYLYRTQTSLELKNSKFIIDDMEFDLSDIIKHPLKEVDIKNFTGKLVPPEFPPGIIIALKVDGVEYPISFRRQPYDDKSTIKLQNDNYKVLNITIILDEDKEKANVVINLDTKRASSVDELIGGLKLYNGFIKGTVDFDNNRITELLKTDEPVDWIPEALDIWNHVLEIESRLGLFFNPSVGLENDDVALVHEIYQSMIKGEPLLIYNPFTSITVGDYTPNSDKPIFNVPNISFEFIERWDLNILDEAFIIYSASILSDFQFTKKRKLKDGRTKLYMKPEDGKSILLSRHLFADEIGANEYLRSRH